MAPELLEPATKRHDPVTARNRTRFGQPVDKKFHGRPWKTYRRIVVAVGTTIADRPPQSGRTVARSGLRMMPTFPLSPLSVGSRTDAKLLRSDLSVAPRFLWECLTNRIVS